jgi:glyoxylase-like metal-dependent hydrolase (beta-lactamase superfamily II)
VRMREILRLPPGDSIIAVHDGEMAPLGGRQYEVIWTPGHSDDHICLLRDDGLFFAGDHVLPAITPNIGLFPEARPDPLRDYFASLARLQALPARLTLPGHGRPFTGLRERADALRGHHEERGATVLAEVAARLAGASAWEVTSALFEGRLCTVEDQRFALVESLAHLEYLRGTGQVRRERQDDVFTYTLAAVPSIVSAS